MDPIRFADGKIYTLDKMGGISVYGEDLRDIDGSIYREWIPWRSKLAALIKKNGELPALPGPLLYLGAAQGTTVSHISDLLPDSVVFAVEFSETAYRKLSKLALERGNIVPILADAFHPERYSAMVGKVRTLYQDVSQKDQVGMFLKNSSMLVPGGSGILMVKARSVDMARDPSAIYNEIVRTLKDAGWAPSGPIGLDPYQADHACLMLIKR
jgi:fibrillarin-like pre-rRNA processing protein